MHIDLGVTFETGARGVAVSQSTAVKWSSDADELCVVGLFNVYRRDLFEPRSNLLCSLGTVLGGRQWLGSECLCTTRSRFS
jgi:hypothetical protein